MCDGNVVSAQTRESQPQLYREVFACLDCTESTPHPLMVTRWRY